MGARGVRTQLRSDEKGAWLGEALHCVEPNGRSDANNLDSWRPPLSQTAAPFP
jgi:hypothetical protein